MKQLMQENYDISQGIVMNMEKEHVYTSSDYNIREWDIYSIEKTLTDEEKLAIIDNRKDGLGTYLLDLIKKYNIAREDGSIKKAKYGSLNKRSLQAWIDRNDIRHAMCNVITKSYGEYYLFNQVYRMTLETPQTEFGYKLPYDGENVVRSWFHNMLRAIDLEEVKYFKTHDKKEIMKKKVKDRLDSFSMIKHVNIDIDSVSLDELDAIDYMLDNCELIVNATLEEVSKIASKEVL